jgi:hypothetical protein
VIRQLATSVLRLHWRDRLREPEKRRSGVYRPLLAPPEFLDAISKREGNDGKPLLGFCSFIHGASFPQDYSVAAAVFVRQLFGPHFSMCP